MGLLTVGLAACSSEDEVLSQGSQAPTADNVYMALNLSFPQSRSNTDETGDSNSNAAPDVEVGVGDENKVSNLTIYLVDPTTNTIEGQGFAVPATGNTLVGANGNYVAKFDGQTLKASAGKQVQVYVVCNGTQTMTGTFDKSATFDVANAYTEGVAAPWNPFIMSNAKQSAKIDLPTANDMALKYSNPTTPFKLGVVEVERAAARFDYMSAKPNDIYVVQETFEQAEGTTQVKEYVNVQLTDMSVLNVSKKEYVFRHVGNESGTLTDICVPETPADYVLTPDWAENATAKLEPNCWNSRDAQFKDKNSVKYLSLTTPMRGEDNWTGTEANRGDYKPMAYSSEVTSTKQPAHDQISSIVFRGKLVAGKDCPTELKTILEGTDATKAPVLYAYDNKVYGTWTEVEKAVKTSSNHGLLAAYSQVVEESKQADGNVKITNAIAVKAGFTVYAMNPTTKAYDVYYYYENRHNDAGDNKGSMYYGVVRNNVYKLKVNKIAKYGHPFDPTGDPDPYKPEEKVDPENVYFEVGVKVLPWTVRVNDIEF